MNSICIVKISFKLIVIFIVIRVIVIFVEIRLDFNILRRNIDVVFS